MSNNGQAQSRPQLVISFHIGTKYSRISYATSDADPAKPTIVRFSPSHTQNSPAFDSAILYGKNGEVLGAGNIHVDVSSIEGARLITCFKYHLFPINGAYTPTAQALYPLPVGKTITDVFADFLRELNKYAIAAVNATKDKLIFEYSDSPAYVLTYPIPDSIPTLCAAAVRAGLVPNSTEGRMRLNFISEAQATGCFFTLWPSTQGIPNCESNEYLILVEMGAGATSVTVCPPDADGPQQANGISMSTPYEGGNWVTGRFYHYLHAVLQGSKYTWNDVVAIVRGFETRTQPEFHDFKGVHFIRFSDSEVTDEAYNIFCGHFKLQGTDIARFFEPSIGCVVNTVVAQLEWLGKTRPSTVILLGGLSHNEWVYARLKNTLGALGLQCVRPSGLDADCAISDGAIKWYLSQAKRSKLDNGRGKEECAL